MSDGGIEFVFSYGSFISRRMQSDDYFEDYKITPQGAVVKTARIKYVNTNFEKAKYWGSLVAIEFLDEENESLLKVGDLSEDKNCSIYEVVLN